MTRVEMLGGLRSHVVGEGSAGGLTVVLLHGFGAPGTDLVPLADALDAPEGTRFVFPEAPLELPWGYDSRAWWLIDMEKLQRAMATGQPREMSGDVPPGLPAARQSVVALLADLETRFDAPPERVVLGGFSQGSMLALDVVLRHEAAFAGLVLWSTTLLMESEWMPLMARRAGMRAVMSHGMQDPLLPFAAAERLQATLRDAGWSVAWHPFRGAHEIPEVALQAAAQLIAEA